VHKSEIFTEPQTIYFCCSKSAKVTLVQWVLDTRWLSLVQVGDC